MTKNNSSTPTQNNNIDLLRTKKTQDRGLQYHWEEDVLICPGQWKVKMEKALSLMPKKLKISLKTNTISFLQEGNYASSTLRGVFETIRIVLAKYPTEAFDLKWMSQAVTHPQFQRAKGSILNFFVFWNSMDTNAIGKDTILFLKDSAPRQIESRNVLSDDPEKSWLSNQEYESLLRAVWDNYDSGISSTQVTLIKLLSMQYARRPIQIAHLKIGDIRESDGTDGLPFQGVVIDFPGAKDRKSEFGYRDSKIESHPLAEHLWKLCKIQCGEARLLYEYKLGIKLTDNQLNKLPLFCCEDRIAEAKTIIEQHLKLNISDELDHRLFHLKSLIITKILSWAENTPTCAYEIERVEKTLRPVTPISHRTGSPIVITATRMRHTRARQLARKGLPIHVLSHWLGHTSRISIAAYYNDPAEEARKLDEALAPSLTPIAMAFTGSLIDSEDYATRALDIDSKVEFAREGLLKNVGSCGKHSYCGTTSIPVPCYRCKYFEPLVDAPHEEVLAALLQRQNAENNLPVVGGLRNLLIPIDLSNDIRAVKHCIARCIERKLELKKRA